VIGCAATGNQQKTKIEANENLLDSGMLLYYIVAVALGGGRCYQHVMNPIHLSDPPGYQKVLFMLSLE